MLKKTASEYIQTYFNDRTPLESGQIALPKKSYEKISQFGQLTFGMPHENSIFTAIKILANEYSEVNHILSYTSTPIGKLIDKTLIANPEDPWFDTILVYRPDMLVSYDHRVYTNELEIVVGGTSAISLLQQYIHGNHVLLEGLLSNMRECLKQFEINGKIAFLADRNGASENSFFQWLPKEFGSDIVIAFIDQLDFRKEGVYYNNERIGLAHIFMKAHKLTENVHKKDITLLQYWLQKKIILTSPPSLIMDNKSIMYLLQSESYRSSLENLLGKERYQLINEYLPRTYFMDSQSLIEHPHLNNIINNPWHYGKFVVKYPTLWGSKNMIVSPDSETAKHQWLDQLTKMLTNTKKYGPLLVQEMIDVLTIPFIHHNEEHYGKTKFTPFFSYNPFTKIVEKLAIAVNITPNSFTAHLDKNSRFALVKEGLT